MKKLLIAAMMVAAIGSTAFAADVKKLSLKVKNSFESQFADAQNVSWSFGEKFTKATFMLDDQQMEAFYSPDGETIGYTKDIEIKQLPKTAVQKINKTYAEYKISGAIEFTNDEVKNYYVSIASGNKKLILEVSPTGDVRKFNPFQ